VGAALQALQHLHGFGLIGGLVQHILVEAHDGVGREHYFVGRKVGAVGRGFVGGEVFGDFGAAQIASASTGASGDIKFTVSITTETQTTEATFTGTISGNEMRGTVTTVGSGNGTFSGTRAGGAPSSTVAPRPQGEQPPANTPPPTTPPSMRH